MGSFDQFKAEQQADKLLAAKPVADMTPEELAAAEKKLTSQKVITAVFIGLLLGVAAWSATHGGFLLPCVLLFFACLIGYRSNQRLKSLQAEMSRRENVG